MPVTLQPTTLKYKDGQTFVSADCLKGDPGSPGDPTQLIDDTAGSGDTDKTWSADKLTSKADTANPNFTGSISMGRVANTTVGEKSTATGNLVTASGPNSNAEGYGTTASGNSTHAEGNQTFAVGDYSHSQGYGTRANGDASSAEGNGTVANGANSSVSGMYNVPDSYANWPDWAPNTYYAAGAKVHLPDEEPDDPRGEYFVCNTPHTSGTEWITYSFYWDSDNGKMNYAQIVGNGSNYLQQSNAYTLDWNGNGSYAGDVTINKGTVDEVSVSALKTEINSKQDAPAFTESGNSISIIVDAGTIISQLDVALLRKQSGSGTPDPTNYRPISGFDDTVITVNGTDKTITFGNTFYGGTVKALKGQATEEYYYHEFDGTEEWTSNTAGTNYICNLDIPRPIPYTDDGYDAICTHLRTEYVYSLSLILQNNTTATGFVLLQPASTFASVSDWKSFLAQQNANGTPVAVCYKMATPVNVSTDSISVSTVQGENTFESDDGDIALTYLGSLIPVVSGKLDRGQGVGNAGKYMVVGNDGNIVPVDAFFAKEGISTTFSGKMLDVNAKGNQTVTAVLESENASVDVWQYEDNMLPMFTAGSIGDVVVTVESDGTIVLNGTTSGNGAISTTMNIPFVKNGNAPFDKYMFSYEMNKAAPNSSGYIYFRVHNQSDQNFAAYGFRDTSDLTGSIANSYDTETTSIKRIQLYLYNIPDGVVFNNWKIKAKLEHRPVATAYSKPSLTHKTVNIADGTGETTLLLSNGHNNIITNADGITLTALMEQTNTPLVCGKRWACFGDSITQKNETAISNGEIRYFDIVSAELGLSVVNYGRATTGYSTTGNVNNGQYTERMQNINPNVFDFMTIMGSTNDIAGMSQGTISLGDPTDTGTTTVCGLINTTLDYYYALAPLKPIGMISMLPTSAYGPDLVETTVAENYVNAQKAICARRGIPFLDLYHGSGMRPWVETVRNALFGGGDGIHPNNEGVKWFAPMIREFVKTLM